MRSVVTSGHRDNCLSLPKVFLEGESLYEHHMFLCAIHRRNIVGLTTRRRFTLLMTMATFHKKPLCSSIVSVSAVFFDLDNTLIETRKGDNQACRKVR